MKDKPKQNKEIRAFAGEIQIRMEGDEPSRKVSGYAAVFNRDSEEMWGFIERIAPGAFDEALQVSDVRALFNHDPDKLLARSASGTLRLSADETGLRYEFDAPDTTVGNDLLVMLKRGDISQSSFGFTVEKDSWEFREEGPDIRTIEKVQRLYDVSPVTYPAYPDTTVALRSRDASRPVDPDKEEEDEPLKKGATRRSYW